MTDFSGPDGLREFDRLVIEWAKERGLCSPDNLKNQVLKLVEEFGETLDASVRCDDAAMIDGYGDCLVVCSILCNQVGVDFVEAAEADPINRMTMIALGRLAAAAVRGNDCYEAVVEFVSCLHMRMSFSDIDPADAMSAAWEAIKDRQGVTVDGVFRKEGE